MNLINSAKQFKMIRRARRYQELYERFGTYQVVADTYGVTRECVRQILVHGAKRGWIAWEPKRRPAVWPLQCHYHVGIDTMTRSGAGYRSVSGAFYKRVLKVAALYRKYRSCGKVAKKLGVAEPNVLTILHKGIKRGWIGGEPRISPNKKQGQLLCG